MTDSQPLTFQQAAEMLILFQKTKPPSDDPNYQLFEQTGLSLTKLKTIIDAGEAGSIDEFSKTIEETLWYQKADQKTRSSSAPPLWRLVDDTLGVLGMLCFVAHGPGIAASAGLSTIERIFENAANKAAYDRKMNNVENWRSSELQLVGDSIKEGMLEQTDKKDLEDVLSQVIHLRGLMADMLPTPPPGGSFKPESVIKTGFSPNWLKNNFKSKSDLLASDYFGGVWTLVESPAFLKLVLANNVQLDKTVSLSLTESPTWAMKTAGVYCSVISVVVSIIKLYATIRLLPEAAFRLGWDPATFTAKSPSPSTLSQFDAAIAAEWKSSDPKSARHCYNYLYDNLNPDAAVNWLSRIDPKTGDAAKAYQTLLRRLNRISRGQELPGYRDGHWFLGEDKTIEVHVESAAIKHPSTMFMN